MIKRFLVLAAFLAMAGCGGGSDKLQIEGANIGTPPGLSNLKGGLDGATDHPPYTDNPLASDSSS